jgi:hypothetical protein
LLDRLEAGTDVQNNKDGREAVLVAIFKPQALTHIRHPEAFARPLPAGQTSKGDGPGAEAGSRNFRAAILRGPRMDAHVAMTVE